MDQAAEEARRELGRGITQAYLCRLNRYALEAGLITDEIYRKMEVSIRTSDASACKGPEA